MLAEHARTVVKAVLIALEGADVAFAVYKFGLLHNAGHRAVIRTRIHVNRAAQTARNAAGKLGSGQTGTLCAAGNAAEQRTRLGGDSVILVYADFIQLGCADNCTADARIGHQHVGAVAEQQERNIALAQYGKCRGQFPAGLRLHEQVGRSADGERGMAAHEFVFCNIYFRCGLSQCRDTILNMLHKAFNPPKNLYKKV